MAATVGQLQSLLGSYVPKNHRFEDYLNQVAPRLLALGNWKGTIQETAVTTDHPYLSLPRGFGSLLSASTTNHGSVPISSRWADIELSGLPTNEGPSSLFGLVDDGWHPTLVDLRDGPLLDGAYGLRLVSLPGAPEALPKTGSVIVQGRVHDTATDSSTEFEAALDGTSEVVFPALDGLGGLVDIHAVLFVGVPAMVRVQAVALGVGSEGLPPLVVAEGRYDEEASYRRFRVGVTRGAGASVTFGLLMKRRWLPVSNLRDRLPVALPVGAFKHGILGVVAEDNADLEGAAYHWGACQVLLQEDTADVRGSARPRLNFDPSGIGEPVVTGMM